HIGLSESDVTLTNHNTVAVGDGTDIIAVGDVTMIADNNIHLDSDSESDGGGLISSADASAETTLNSDTHGNIGSGATIVADAVTVDAKISESHARARASATAGGLFGNTDADATVNGTSTTDITIGGGGTTVDGIYGVKFRSDQNNFHVDVSKHSLFIGIG